MAWNILLHIIKASFSIFCLILKIGIQCWKLLFIKLFPLYPYYISSPIWFYSNTDATNIVIERYAFTFQSGSIQIVGNTTSQYYQDHFTFQSGSIQIVDGSVCSPNFINFTFQSGSIQIQWVAVCRCPLCTLHSNLVLFKSSCSCLPLPPIKLYIPIWFYSNVQSVSLYLCLKNLYIPIWFYSNETIRQTQPNYLFSLHSNLVLFKWYN